MLGSQMAGKEGKAGLWVSHELCNVANLWCERCDMVVGAGGKVVEMKTAIQRPAELRGREAGRHPCAQGRDLWGDGGVLEKMVERGETAAAPLKLSRSSLASLACPS